LLTRGTSPATVDVFCAIPLRGTKTEWVNNRLKAWSNFSRIDSAYIDVPGEHYTLMNIENIPQFQKIFRDRLEARGL
jgi:hypothetical protein